MFYDFFGFWIEKSVINCILEEYMAKTVANALKSKNCIKHLYFGNGAELTDFAMSYSPTDYNNGPEIIEMENLNIHDDILLLRHINLFNVTFKFLNFLDTHFDIQTWKC
jgi:hypothetical protein